MLFRPFMASKFTGVPVSRSVAPGYSILPFQGVQIYWRTGFQERCPGLFNIALSGLTYLRVIFTRVLPRAILLRPFGAVGTVHRAPTWKFIIPYSVLNFKIYCAKFNQ
jgi:hypothetical protein